MNHILMTAIVLVCVLGFFALIGLIKSLLRLGIALLVGIAIPTLLYYAAEQLGLAESLPGLVYLLLGALSALSVLLRRRR